MPYYAGSPYEQLFPTSNPLTQALQDADFTPVAIAYLNGVDDSANFPLTITNLATGTYRAAGTIPSTYVFKDQVSIFVDATVAGVAGGNRIDRFTISAPGATPIPPEPSGSSLTPNSSNVSYLSPSDFILFVDIRQLEQYPKDDNDALLAAAVLTDPKIAAALYAASGEVESACVAGARYLPQDLLNLSIQGGVSGWMLKKLVSALAVKILMDRRVQPGMEYPPLVAWGLDMLKSLRAGEAVFSFVETEQAGLPNLQPLSGQDLINLGQVARFAHRYYGYRVIDFQKGIAGAGFGRGF